MTEVIECQLVRVPIFADLDDASLRTLASGCFRRRYRGKEVVFHQDEPGHTLYVVLKGRVDIVRWTKSGEEVYIARFGPGECFGELSLLDGSPRSADAITDEPTELLVLRREEFIGCLRQSPGLALAILSCLASRLRASSDLIAAHQVLDVTGRLAALLLELAATHGEAIPCGGVRIAKLASQQELADRIGASREA